MPLASRATTNRANRGDNAPTPAAEVAPRRGRGVQADPPEQEDTTAAASEAGQNTETTAVAEKKRRGPAPGTKRVVAPPTTAVDTTDLKAVRARMKAIQGEAKELVGNERGALRAVEADFGNQRRALASEYALLERLVRKPLF